MSDFVSEEAAVNEEAAVDNEETEKESLGLLSLNTDNIGLILTKFLTIYDVGRIDTAHCNSKKRKHLLKSFSRIKVETYLAIQFASP